MQGRQNGSGMKQHRQQLQQEQEEREEDEDRRLIGNASKTTGDKGNHRCLCYVPVLALREGEVLPDERAAL